MFSAPHTATVGRLVLTYSLKYKSGSTVFTAGKTLTGTTGTATILSTGSAASGNLVIYNITGTFADGTTLTDNGTIPGVALCDGTVTGPNLDSYGQISKTPVTTSISCRFFNTVVSNPASGKVVYSEDDLYVMYPPGTDLLLGDTLTGTATGYAFTFTVSEVKPAYALGTLHHYTAKLTRVS
jgi:hypothetical protein